MKAPVKVFLRFAKLLNLRSKYGGEDVDKSEDPRERGKEKSQGEGASLMCKV